VLTTEELGTPIPLEEGAVADEGLFGASEEADRLLTTEEPATVPFGIVDVCGSDVGVVAEGGPDAAVFAEFGAPVVWEGGGGGEFVIGNPWLS
jgi:hypothetical protein